MADSVSPTEACLNFATGTGVAATDMRFRDGRINRKLRWIRAYELREMPIWPDLYTDNVFFISNQIVFLSESNRFLFRIEPFFVSNRIV